MAFMHLVQEIFHRLSVFDAIHNSLLKLFSFAYMEGRAFRHGDIVSQSFAFSSLSDYLQEDVVSQLVKRGASGAIASMLSKGSKFTGLDVKRVYFGFFLFSFSLYDLLQLMV